MSEARMKILLSFFLSFFLYFFFVGGGGGGGGLIYHHSVLRSLRTPINVFVIIYSRLVLLFISAYGDKITLEL